VPAPRRTSRRFRRDGRRFRGNALPPQAAFNAGVELAAPIEDECQRDVDRGEPLAIVDGNSQRLGLCEMLLEAGIVRRGSQCRAQFQAHVDAAPYIIVIPRQMRQRLQRRFKESPSLPY